MTRLLDGRPTARSLHRRLPRRMAVLLALVCLGLVPEASAWGLAAHRMVNEEAVAALPEPLRQFFAAHRAELSDRAVEPDTVRKARFGKREKVRHFIDLDRYGSPPFTALPRSYRGAVARYGRETVQDRGTLPWAILGMHRRLVAEMRSGRWSAALTTAGLAGHYVADAFMPLHTTANYDGQETGNRGIHEAIERELVDARIRDYRHAVEHRLGPTELPRFDESHVFGVLLESHSNVPALLEADRAARAKGRMASAPYLDSLDGSLRPVLVGRLRAAAIDLGAFWASAWQAAGRPAPPPLSQPHG